MIEIMEPSPSQQLLSEEKPLKESKGKQIEKTIELPILNEQLQQDPDLTIKDETENLFGSQK